MKRLWFNLERIKAGIPLALLVCALTACAWLPTPQQKKQVIPVYPPPPAQPRFTYERTLRSSIDVVKEDATARFRRLATGEERRGEGLAKPFDVVARSGRVYVGDTVRRAVIVFDIRNGKFFEIGKEEPGKLYMPLGLAIDAAGNLYVCDGTAKRVTVYDKTGKFLRAIGGSEYFHRPSGLAVDAAGTRVYVVDTGGVTSQEHRVRVFDSHSGKHLLDIGKRGNGIGEFNLPREAVVAPNGLLYVVDGGNFRVQVFRQDGRFVRSFGAIGRRPGQFSRPKGIAVDPHGNIYVVDAAFGNVQMFTPEGQLLMSIGDRGARDGPGHYMLPAGINVDETGRVYVVDQFYRKVDIYRPVTAKEATNHK